MTSMKNNLNLSELIETITPLNNIYRDLIDKKAKGSEVLEVMWDTGKLLKQYLNATNIKPHNLYWQIYGRAEGIKNSYITRDFLSYCLRINKYFEDKSKIKKDFGNTKLYSSFREAFPLLENPRFAFSGSEKNALIKLLNSDLSPREIKKRVVELKNRKIGIKNTRTQKLPEMKTYTDQFVDFYNNIFRIVTGDKLWDPNPKFTKNHLTDISDLISSFSQENLFVPTIKLDDTIPQEWVNFVQTLIALTGKSVEVRNRFRRLVSPKKLTQLADMVNALRTEKEIDNYRKKLKIDAGSREK